MNKRKATGVLASLIAEKDSRSRARTRNKMSLAVKIETAMKEKGLSQKAFSKMMEKSESEISEWLSGTRNFTVDTLTDIEEALGISLLNTKMCYTTRIDGKSMQYNIPRIGNSVCIKTNQPEWDNSCREHAKPEKYLIAS